MRNPFSTPRSAGRPPFRLGALILHSLPIVLTFLFSLAIFALEQTAFLLLRVNNQSIQVTLPLNPEADPVTVHLSIDRLPTNLIIGTTIAAAAYPFISGLAFWELRNGGVHAVTKLRRRVWLAANVFLTITNLAVVMSCLGVVFVREKESKSQFGPRMRVQEGAEVEATREAWLCKLYELDSEAEWAKHGCGAAKAGRWLLAPLGVCAFALVVVCAAQCWRVLRGEKRIAEKKHHILATEYGIDV